MPMIQIRDVPPQLHRVLKARAASEGKTLSAYLLGEVAALAERPTTEELLARIRGRARVSLRESSSAAVRAEREGRR